MHSFCAFILCICSVTFCRNRAVFCGNCLCNFHAVHGGGHNAACIACSFAAGVYALLAALQIFIPGNADRGRGTALHARKDGIWVVKAWNMPGKLAHSLDERCCDFLWEQLVEGGKTMAAFDGGGKSGIFENKVAVFLRNAAFFKITEQLLRHTSVA